MESVLVTGGAGYKGIILTTKLLVKKYKVTVVDNFMYGYDPILHLVNDPNLNITKGDIRNGIPNLEKYDIVFHLAGISGFPACASNPHSAHLINVEATRGIVKKMARNQILINASTTSIYGKSEEPCNESTYVDPQSTYAMTKLMAERIVQDEKENAISLRFATIFGPSPKMRMDLMVNDFTYKACKEGTLVLFDSYAKRTFLHIQDAADVYILALDNYESMKGNVFNAGDNSLNFSKLEIAKKINKKVPFEIINSEMKDKDLRHFTVDFSKIKELGFKPQKTVEDGIDELLKMFSFYEYYSHYKPI